MGSAALYGLRLFVSGHITFRQCWGSFAIQPPECWLRELSKGVGTSEVTM